MGPLESITWQSLTTGGGIATLLVLGVVPLAKSFGARDNALRITALAAGQLVAQVAFGIVAGGVSLTVALTALLVGYLGATSAMGTYELIKPFQTPPLPGEATYP